VSLTPETARDVVREEYAKIALAPNNSVGCGTSCCSAKDFQSVSLAIGYTEEDVESVPEGANLGLGCGNPQAIAELKPGEVVLDLGSGAGFDCLLAAKQVGPTGRVIGVDMTHEMLRKARGNAAKMGVAHVEFRLGEIENLPVADHSVDVIISNCVINLSPDKRRVFQEAYRVLKAGGRLAISDVVAAAALPEHLASDLKLLAGCVAGAERIPVLEEMLRDIGFRNVTIVPKSESAEFLRDWSPGSRIEDYVVSATIQATK
jgi:arsenite methyltransferase